MRKTFRIILLYEFDQLLPNVDSQIPDSRRILCTDKGAEFHGRLLCFGDLKYIDIAIPEFRGLQQTGQFLPQSRDRQGIIRIDKDTAEDVRTGTGPVLKRFLL